MRYIVKVNPKYAGIREWVEKVVREGMPADGEVIYRGRNVLYRADAGQRLEVHCEANRKGYRKVGETGDGMTVGETGEGRTDRKAGETGDGMTVGENGEGRTDRKAGETGDGMTVGENVEGRTDGDMTAGEDARRLMVVVKEFKKPNLVNAYVYTTVRTSKAERSYRNAMRMSELGFLTPEPVAYGEVRNGIKLVSSCYICRELTGASEMRNWEDFPNAGTLIPAFAREIYRLHQAGVWHKDFSPRNILYKETAAEKKETATGKYDFYYVDLNRMKFGVHDRKRQMSMFRSINLNPAETRKLAGYYAAVAGLDKATTEKEALEQLAGYFAERKRKSKLKSLFKRG